MSKWRFKGLRFSQGHREPVSSRAGYPTFLAVRSISFRRNTGVRGGCYTVVKSLRNEFISKILGHRESMAGKGSPRESVVRVWLGRRTPWQDSEFFGFLQHCARQCFVPSFLASSSVPRQIQLLEGWRSARDHRCAKDGFEEAQGPVTRSSLLQTPLSATVWHGWACASEMSSAASPKLPLEAALVPNS